MPDNTITQQCPKTGCLFTTKTRNMMRRHFRCRHPDDIIIISEEGILPQCHECGLFQQNVNSEKHLSSEDCKKYAERRKRRKNEQIKMAANNVTFKVQNDIINNVKQFKYLGRIIQNNDDDLPAIEAQIKKAKMMWGNIIKILKYKNGNKNKKINPKTMSIFYKVIVQTILLYGSETWVVCETGRRKLSSFHNRCARYITGRHIKQQEDGTWVYPCSKITRKEADLLTVEEYIQKRKQTITPFAEEQEIFTKCRQSESLIRSSQLMWWTQEIVPKTVPISQNSESVNGFSGVISGRVQ